MKLVSSRSLESLKPALMDPSSSGPDPVYEVYNEINEPGWVNKTIIKAGKLGREYTKTFGHYHGVNVDEIYHLVEGEGILVMQKKIEGKDDEVSEVLLINVKPGEEVLITPEWGHSWSNTGSIDLVSYDNWDSGHTPSDYNVIELQRGMAYYLIEEDGEVKPVPNPHYKNLPEPRSLTAQEFKDKNY